MVDFVELKIDWKKANSLDLKGRAEYFDNLAEKIAKASVNEDDKKQVLAGDQVCYIAAKYEELFLTCYKEFDVSRTLAKKVEGKTLEEQMDYFNTLAKKISKIEKVNPVSVPYGNRTCKIEAKYAGLFEASYREFAKCQRELKRLKQPTVTIDYKVANGLNNEKRADYFADLLKTITKVPLRDDAELVTIDRLSQKVNKNDIEVFKECFNEFMKSKKAFEKEYEELLKKADEEVKEKAEKIVEETKKVTKKKSYKQIMDANLEVLTKIVSKPKTGRCVRKYIGSAAYIISINDEKIFDQAKNNYLEAKMKYTREIRQMARQHEYEIDKKVVNKLDDEERKDYLENLLNNIINREIFMDTVEVNYNGQTYTINEVDKKTFKYCESTISGLKHMLAVHRKASKNIIFADNNWNNPNNFEVIDGDLEEQEEEKEPKKSFWQKVKDVKDKQKAKKEKVPKKEKVLKTPKAAMSVDLIDRLYQYRINELTSKPITHGTRILVGDMEYRVDHKYKNRLYKIMISYDKYKQKKAKYEAQSAAQKAFRGLVAAGALILGLVGVSYAKNTLDSAMKQVKNNTRAAIEQEAEYVLTDGSYSTRALAAMAMSEGKSYDEVIKDIVAPEGDDEIITETFELGSGTITEAIDEVVEETEETVGAITSGVEIAVAGVVSGENASVSGDSDGSASVSGGDAESLDAEKESQENEAIDDKTPNDGDINKNEAEASTDAEKRKNEHDNKLAIEDEEEEIEKEEEEEEETLTQAEDAAKGVSTGVDNGAAAAAEAGSELVSQTVKTAIDEAIYEQLEYVETYETIRDLVEDMDELPEETILNENINADKGNEEICYGYHLTTGNTIYDMPMWEALEVMYVGNEEDANTYQSALAVFSCIANRMEDGRFTYATDFHSIISAGNGGQFSVWNQTKASNFQLDQVPDYVLKAFYDCFYCGIRNVDTIEFRASSNKADGRFQVVAGDNNHFKLVQHVDRADVIVNEVTLAYKYSDDE